MSDAQILEAMQEVKLNMYLDEYSKENDNYEECLSEVAKEAKCCVKFLVKLAHDTHSKYGYDVRTILDEMIYSEIEAEAFNENK